jgi:hypothetical protein
MTNGKSQNKKQQKTKIKMFYLQFTQTGGGQWYESPYPFFGVSPLLDGFLNMIIEYPSTTAVPMGLDVAPEDEGMFHLFLRSLEPWSIEEGMKYRVFLQRNEVSRSRQIDNSVITIWNIFSFINVAEVLEATYALETLLVYIGKDWRLQSLVLLDPLPRRDPTILDVIKKHADATLQDPHSFDLFLSRYRVFLENNNNDAGTLSSLLSYQFFPIAEMRDDQRFRNVMQYTLSSINKYLNREDMITEWFLINFFEYIVDNVDFEKDRLLIGKIVKQICRKMETDSIANFVHDMIEDEPLKNNSAKRVFVQKILRRLRRTGKLWDETIEEWDEIYGEAIDDAWHTSEERQTLAAERRGDVEGMRRDEIVEMEIDILNEIDEEVDRAETMKVDKFRDFLSELKEMEVDDDEIVYYTHPPKQRRLE